MAEYSIATGNRDEKRLSILNEIYTPHTEALLSKVLKRGDTVLELGCGTGIVSALISSMVGPTGSVTATDACDKQLELAKKNVGDRTNVSIQSVSAYSLEHLGQQFDVVYCRFLLVHLRNLPSVIQQIYKVLKPGGLFIVEDTTGFHTVSSRPPTTAIDMIHHLGRIQVAIQGSDDQYFDTLPTLLTEGDFSVEYRNDIHPQLETVEHRLLLCYNLPSIRRSLIEKGGVGEEEYQRAVEAVKDLVYDPSIKIDSYALGQIVARKI